MTNLNTIFEDFEKRKQEENDALRQDVEKASKLRESTTKVLKEKVIPTVEQISESIKQKGHKSNVIINIENFSNPHVELSFTPIIKRLNMPVIISTSKLTFIHNKEGKLSIRQEIQTEKGRLDQYSPSQENNLELDKVNEEEIKAISILFINSVLKSN
jgi:hypothetical protein